VNVHEEDSENHFYNVPEIFENIMVKKYHFITKSLEKSAGN